MVKTKEEIQLASKPYSIRNFADWAWYFLPALLIMALGIYLGFKYQTVFTFEKIVQGFQGDFYKYLLIGIFAQLVDSTLGMGYGATSTSFLLSIGVPPALSSMGVHVAEMFTTGVSAVAQHKFGNINRKLLKSLLLPGILGSLIGAYLLSTVIDGNSIKPYISLYMVVLAIIIIIKALRKNIKKKKTKNLGVLAVFGGFMDAVGGGGWGPIVTSTLLSRGRNPRYTIGSVNAAEFAVAFASGVTFLLFGSISGWKVICGLILGGIIASPLGAYFVNKVPQKKMQILVGILIIFLSLNTLYKVIF
jgi:uncharacterized protein